MARVVGGSIVWNLDVDNKKLTSGLKQAKNQIDKTAKSSIGKLKKLGSAFTRFLGPVAIGAGIGAGIKQLATFEQSIANISTLVAGDATQSMDALSSGIKDIAKNVPKSPEELGASAYAIFSAGITDTTVALETLDASARLAVAGLGTTEEATDLMTSSLNAFAGEGLDASEVSDILFTTVKNGKTTVNDLAQSFGATAPIIAQAGIKLSDFSAATAALTTTGLPASQAQNSLRQAIVSLQKPTAEMQDLFDKIGVKSGQELINTSENLGDVFGKLSVAADGDDETLARAFGSVEALNGVLGITSGNVGQAYIDTLADMDDGTRNIDDAFQKQKETLSSLWQIVKNQVIVALVNFGTVALDAIKRFSETPAWATIQSVFGTIKTAVMIVIDVFRGFDPAANMDSETSGKWKTFIDIVLKAKDGFDRFVEIAKNVFDIVLKIYQGVADFLMPTFTELWGTIKNELLPVLKEFWDKHGNAILSILKGIGIALIIFAAIIIGTAVVALFAIIKVVTLVISWFSKFVGFSMRTSDAIKDAFSRLGEALAKPFRSAFDKIKDIFTRIKDFISEKSGQIKDSLDRINPFHRESPSLVDNVKAGVGEIKKQYGSLGGVKLPSVASSIDVPTTSASGTSVAAGNTFNIEMNGVMARSRTELADIAIDLVKAADERLAGSGKPTIMGT